MTKKEFKEKHIPLRARLDVLTDDMIRIRMVDYKMSRSACARYLIRLGFMATMPPPNIEQKEKLP